MKNKITEEEFNKLTHDEQAWYIWNHASHLHVREVNGYRVNLFALYDFYIEVWYFVYDNSIKKIRAFESSDLLAPYLDLIKIEVLAG